MIPNTALELSIEQLIGALTEKLFMECTKVKSTTSPVSHARLTAEVQVPRNEEKLSNIYEITHRLTLWRNGSKTFFAK